jgi:hypothetical protein
VAWKRHAFNRQADAAPDFHVQHRQRERNARAPVEDLVQVAVARIVVVLRIPRVAEFREQELVERGDPLLGAVRVRQAAAQPGRQALDLAEVAVDVQARVGILCDQEARARQVDRRLFAGHQLRKGIRGRHQDDSCRAKSRHLRPNA